MKLFLGIDLGTSGIRCAVIDADGAVVGMSRGAYPDSSAAGWWAAVKEGLDGLKTIIGANGMQSIQAIAIDGTSGSMVLVDETITPVTEPLMYNSNGFDEEAVHIADYAPLGDMTRGSSSALGRLLRLQTMDADGQAKHLCHQADFILAKLTGKAGYSDENNSLKTGYDVTARCWPAWIDHTHVKTELLPDVRPVGTPIATVSPAIANEFGFASNLMLHAGTTDSIAAFLATGASQIGDVVTSLGTTLAIKMLSDVRIDDPAQGIYSHRLGYMWLVGGASNTGGGALLAHFGTDDLAQLSPKIDASKPSGLNYYPLPRRGERFPINDPSMEPIVTPRPADDALFLQGLFEGVAQIEARCYQALQERGAPAINHIFTAGGGASNATWLKIRQRLIPQTFVQATQSEAAIGVARLAARGTQS
jgi:sugar (pentulose or hexulose) kinase